MEDQTKPELINFNRNDKLNQLTQVIMQNPLEIDFADNKIRVTNNPIMMAYHFLKEGFSASTRETRY